VPPGARRAILTTAAETDGRHDLIEAVQPPGERTPLHLHTRYDERFWVVSGSPAGFAELIERAGTPARLATPDTAFDAELFAAVTTELGDVIVGPPGMTPADLPEGQAG
jgi:hypothetical protein